MYRLFRAPGAGSEIIEWVETKIASPAGADGFCELLELDHGTEVVARFTSDEPILKGRAAATRRHAGRGIVIKLAFWPGDDSILRLFSDLSPEITGRLAGPLPRGLQSVPRRDGSFFVINSTSKAARIELRRPTNDRILSRRIPSHFQLRPYDVLWLEG